MSSLPPTLWSSWWHLGWNLFWYFFFESGWPKLDAVFQAWPNKCQAKWDNYIFDLLIIFLSLPSVLPGHSSGSGSTCCPPRLLGLFHQTQTDPSLYCCLRLFHPRYVTSSLLNLVIPFTFSKLDSSFFFFFYFFYFSFPSFLLIFTHLVNALKSFSSSWF